MQSRLPRFHLFLSVWWPIYKSVMSFITSLNLTLFHLHLYQGLSFLQTFYLRRGQISLALPFRHQKEWFKEGLKTIFQIYNFSSACPPLLLRYWKSAQKRLNWGFTFTGSSPTAHIYQIRDHSSHFPPHLGVMYVLSSHEWSLLAIHRILVTYTVTGSSPAAWYSYF